MRTLTIVLCYHLDSPVLQTGELRGEEVALGQGDEADGQQSGDSDPADLKLNWKLREAQEGLFCSKKYCPRRHTGHPLCICGKTVAKLMRCGQ